MAEADSPLSALHIPAGARCLDCGYDLRGLDQPRCPECGRPFDPSDPDTMRLPRSVPQWAMPLLKPYGREMLRTAMVATGIVLLQQVLLGPTAWLRAAVVLWIAVYGVRITLEMLRFWICLHYDQPPPPLQRRWWLPMALLLLSTMLVVTQAPGRLVLLAGRPWMNAKAMHIYHHEPMLFPPKGPMWLGPCLVYEVGLYPRGSLFTLWNGTVLRFDPDTLGWEIDNSIWPD